MAKARSLQKIQAWYQTRHGAPGSDVSVSRAIRRTGVRKASPFALESLEARVLLSADLATAVPVAPVTQNIDASATVSVINSTQATAVVQTNSTASPHLSHLRIADFGRSYGESPWGSASSPSRTEGAVQWFAERVDLTEYQTTVGHFRQYNPTIQSWVYALDLYQFQHEVSGLPESSFLHVSEPTSVTLKDISGNVLANYTIPTGGRFEAAVWNSRHFPFNLQDANLRAYNGSRILNVMGGEAGVFLDAHGTGFSETFKLGRETTINFGGGIQEYGGRRPGDPILEAAYNADVVNWLSELQGRLAAAGKWGAVNQATYLAYDQMARDQAIAIGGFNTEHLISPDALRGAEGAVENLYDLTQRVTAKGGTAILTGKWNFMPANYTQGEYGSADARQDMWRLAFYYLVKEPAGSSGKAYFDLTLPSYNSTDVSSDQSHWHAAYQVDVGQPIGGMTVAQSGLSPSDGAPYKVFTRPYGNAKVLFRPLDLWSSTDYGDRSAVMVQLGGDYRQLREDATLGPVTSSVQIRNAEALILVPASNVTSNVVVSAVTAAPPATLVSTAPTPVIEPTPVGAQPTASPIVTSPAPTGSETKTVAEMLAFPFTSNYAVSPLAPPISEPVVTNTPAPAPVPVPAAITPEPVATTPLPAPIPPPAAITPEPVVTTLPPAPMPPAAPITPEPLATTPPPSTAGERSYTVAEMLAMDWTTR